MIEIREAVASNAENILEYCKAVGAESDNLTFGAEGVSAPPGKRNGIFGQRPSPKETTLSRGCG